MRIAARSPQTAGRAGGAALVAIIAILLAACQSTGPVRSSDGSPGVRATFILANPAGLLALDENARTLGRIVDLPPNSAPATPVMHPNGKSLAFAITQVPTKSTGFGSDIWTVNLDGSGMKPLLEHEADTVFYATPRFDPTGNILYVHRRVAVLKNGSFVGNEDAILRIDLRTSERRTLLTDGADPTLSPDGRTLVYVDLKDGQGDGLWTANADGTGARPLLKGRDTFWYLQSPRFDSTGLRIAFSAAGHSATAVDRMQARLQERAGGSPRAHLGVPSELFLAPLDGTSVTSVAQTGDDVTPAWSPDGLRLAYIGTGAFFSVTVADRSVKSLAQSNDFFFGDLLWIR